ncbi:MAG: (d)CMP kinase [Eubacteriales bacterium]
MNISIAIDGPAGAGKSTIAKLVAQKRRYIYVDTGAMYRAMGLYMSRQGIDVADQEAVSQGCVGAEITIVHENGEQVVILNGEKVNDYIRTSEIGMLASAVAKNPGVREKLVQLQQQLAQGANIVMDGRDIGTCVLPHADVKVYLTASTHVRAKRRYDELQVQGAECSIEQIEQEIKERDITDMNREHSPLVQASDAIYLDSSDMTIEQVANKIISFIVELCNE